MKDELHSLLASKTNDLRGVLAVHSTETILGHCAWFMYMDRYAVYRMVGLKASHAQCLWALSLMLNTPQPPAPQRLNQKSWRSICQLLEDVYGCYWRNFEAFGNGKSDGLTFSQRQAVAGYFMHQHGAPRIASLELLSARVTDILSPFDATIRSAAGLSASDALRVASWMIDATQSDVDRYNRALIHNTDGLQPEEAWQERPDWLLDPQWHHILASSTHTTFPIPPDRADRLFTVSPEDMKREFGDGVAEGFCHTFVSVRGDSLAVVYPTERNAAEQRPVFFIDNHRLFHPPGRFIYNAILDNFTDILMASHERESFLKRRDHVLEMQTATALSRFFGSHARILTEVFDEDGHEHDLVVLWNDKMLVVEAKASPPTEPFRDAEKAWIRLSRAFQSDRGIQKAFEQARRLIRLATLDQPLRLFDEKGKLVVNLPVGAVKEALGVCVTADDHGPVATDLSILLKRDNGDRYPWAVSIFELQTILDGFAHVGIGPDRLFEFLRERQQLHGRVLPYDESEVAGIFMRYGTLKDLLAVEADEIVLLLPKDGDVFDEIYLEKRGGPKAVTKANGPYRLNHMSRRGPEMP